MPSTYYRKMSQNRRSANQGFPRKDVRASHRNAGPAPANGIIERDLRNIEYLANLFDTAFRIPGTRFRVGLDSIIGLVPGVGDALAVGPFFYMLHVARRHRMPKRHIARMFANQGFDFLIGLVPVAGDLADAIFKSHARNAKLLKRHLEKRRDERFIEV